MGEDLIITGLPQFRCIKVIGAAKIKEIDGNRLTLDVAGQAVTRQFGDAELEKKPVPEVGWYWVVYGNGYHSFSPAKAFEEGYVAL